MPDWRTKQGTEVGASPGSLDVPAGALSTRAWLTAYDSQGVRVQEEVSAEQLLDFLDNFAGAATSDVSDPPDDDQADGLRLWVDLRGLEDVELLREVASRLGVHSLAVEDVLHVPQRPKEVRYEHFHQVVLQMLVPNRIDQFEQFNLFVGHDWVLTVQERHEDPFDPVRNRLQRPAARLRRHGSGYLGYALLDSVVDAYYPHLETLQHSIDTLEGEVFVDQRRAVLGRVHGLRTTLLELRRAASPQREVLHSLLLHEESLFGESLQPFLRDVFDHAVEIVDQLDNNREEINNLTNLYLSLLSQRTNDVMRWLTVMASLFIPLTFIVGVYGMNFEYMPELALPWGYAAVWGVMVGMVVALLVFFWRKGWLRDD